MPSKKKPKEQESKKAAQKKKQQKIQDLTFGLKNKKNSKVVQRKINAAEKSVNNAGDPRVKRLEDQRKKAKADAKARKKSMEEERNALFGEALMAVKKKGKSTSQKGGKIEAKGRDADDEMKKPGQSRAMKMMFQMDAKEMEERLKEDPDYIPTLEDEIEAQRQKKVLELKTSGKGTPVTPETFKTWQEKKRKRKADKSKELVEAELKKKKGGKGLAVLSGRALYEYKRELFLDDETVSTDAMVSLVASESPKENIGRKSCGLIQLSDEAEQKLKIDEDLFDDDVELPDF